MTNPFAIEIMDLKKSFNKTTALTGLTFRVKQGSIFGLLGPNGAGKSTAVRIMTSLSQPDSGIVKLLGQDASRDKFKIRKMIGYVAQQSSVDGEFTAKENLQLQGRLYGLRRNELKERVANMLEQFDLTDVADKLSKTYSGGMKRKLDIAMGIIHRPNILFLDEPTTGLDPEARSSLWETIKSLANNENLTVLLTTHYLEEADQLSDYLAIIDKGKVVVEGTSESLKKVLNGDMLQLEVKDDELHLAQKLLPLLAGIEDIFTDGPNLFLRTSNGAERLPAVMSFLEKEGITVQSATVSRPSLDDVYLHYTGRSFQEAQKEQVILR
ncbi:ATP-binding cassette domain-containing protein [Salipaludibacillus sp. HK11]|uniref:ATP-binding cassette domain-containing protein n=1 Tax=Salipaludibacillus sp. HK11 TaxID=3394320 RepID=UPI0039FDB419